jgi:hypothetical protein
MAEIAEPIHSLLTTQPLLPLRTPAQVNNNLKILILQYRAGALLIHALRLPVHEQLQHRLRRRRRPVVNRPETHARPLGHHSTLADAIGIPDRAQNAPPVCVPAVQRRLDERRARDGGCDAVRGGVAGRVLHAHGDEFGGALAVADDELRERLREGGEHGLQREVVGRGGRSGGDGVSAGGAVGEQRDGVVGAGVAVDGDGVEGARDGVQEKRLEGGGVDGGVGAEHAEERGHVGVDHAGAFGHAGEAVGDAGRGGEGEGLGNEFGECVGGADCAGCGEPGVVCVGQVGVGGGDFVQDFGDGESAHLARVRGQLQGD